jgi:predicted nucleic acid-binding protein
VNLLVIDVSVAAKWSLRDETLVEEAVALLNSHGRREIELIVPDLFWAEFGNILWKAIRRSRCTPAGAEANIAAVKDLNLTTVPSSGLIEQAFKIATRFNRTVYDSLYVALAVESRAQLITADEKMANALAAHLPVKWLGARA